MRYIKHSEMKHNLIYLTVAFDKLSYILGNKFEATDEQEGVVRGWHNANSDSLMVIKKTKLN